MRAVRQGTPRKDPSLEHVRQTLKTLTKQKKELITQLKEVTGRRDILRRNRPGKTAGVKPPAMTPGQRAATPQDEEDEEEDDSHKSTSSSD